MKDFTIIGVDPADHPLHEGHEVCEQEAERLDEQLAIEQAELADGFPEDDPSVQHEGVYE